MTLADPDPDRRALELVASLQELADLTEDLRRAFPGTTTEGGYLAGRFERALGRLALACRPRDSGVAPTPAPIPISRRGG